ncbi:hypothetical protein VP01_329g7 [Puccinia sorghi]|uniref:Uncharacterized protein n=1 Tax=Puccinia sorghi TaxID=27349 RepID=A0A0L6UYE2_9BASI|nr:hypothetical protein VP01_329g7 [Puccinia sorghi]
MGVASACFFCQTNHRFSFSRKIVFNCQFFFIFLNNYKIKDRLFKQAIHLLAITRLLEGSGTVIDLKLPKGEIKGCGRPPQTNPKLLRRSHSEIQITSASPLIQDYHVSDLASFKYWINMVADLGKDIVHTTLQLKMESPGVLSYSFC